MSVVHATPKFGISSLPPRSLKNSMAAANTHALGGPSWSLQTKGRASLPLESCSARSARLLESGHGFAEWTNVPPVGVPDPYIADQVRPGRRVLTGPTSGHAAEPYEGGKRIVGPSQSEAMPAGKRAFPELSGRRSTDQAPPRGLKRVESRARRDEPARSDPNSTVKTTIDRIESVKMFSGVNQANYHCWVPGELQRAQCKQRVLGRAARPVPCRPSSQLEVASVRPAFTHRCLVPCAQTAIGTGISALASGALHIQTVASRGAATSIL